MGVNRFGRALRTTPGSALDGREHVVDGERRTRHRVARSPRPRGGLWWIDAAIVVVGVALAISQFLANRIMSAFDSGVYFGAASQFAAGHLPYRDFVFVQPPGALVLLWPWAFIGRWTSTSVGFELARAFMVVVVAAVAVLVSRLLRPHGRSAALVGGLAVAFAPTAAFEMTAVKLEPYCLLLGLAGAYGVIQAQGRDPRTTRRLIVAAGVALGVAGAVKLWALLLFLALVVCVWRIGRSLVLRFVAATGAGFALFAGPFFVLAPTQFINQVILAQLLRTHNAQGTVTLMNRLSQLTGLRNTPLALNGVEIFAFYGLILVVSVLGYFLGGPRSVSDDFFLIATALTMLALLASKEFYNYYGYFLAPLMVGQVVSSVSRVARAVRSRESAGRSASRARHRRTSLRLAAGLLIAAGLGAGAFSGSRLVQVDAGPNPPTLIDHYIPPGSCVIFDDAIQGILANRLVAASSSCPVIIDSGGLSMTVGGAHPFKSAALARVWRTDFLAVRYVVLAGLTPLGIPWTGALYSWFVAHFHVVFNGFTYVIFRHD